MNFISNLGRNAVRNFVAIFWCWFAAAYLWCVTFHTVPEHNIRVVDTILGFILGTLIGSIISYFFGSTKGSQEKTDIIAQSTPIPKEVSSES